MATLLFYTKSFSVEFLEMIARKKRQGIEDDVRNAKEVPK